MHIGIRRLCAMAGLMIGVLAAAAPSMAAVLFADDFNAGASAAWTNDRGVWRDTGGQYDATNPDNTPLTYTAVGTLSGLTDFAIDVDVNTWDDGGVWIRSNFNGGAINGMLLVTGGKSGAFDGFYWHIVTNGNSGGIVQEKAVAGLQESNHHLRIEASGNTYRVFVDNVLQDTFVDATSAYTSGFAGLYDFSPISGATSPRGQTFDNVVISTLPQDLPEPGSMTLLALGLVGLWQMRTGRALKW